MRSKRQGFFVCLIILSCLVVAWPVIAGTVCFECHGREGFKGTVVHQPVAREQCTACHNPHAARESGLLRSKVDRLCFSCHVKEEKAFQTGFVHQPVGRGECLACHAQHASNVAGLLRGTASEGCFGCHDQLPRQFKYTHRPFAKGDCTVCHQPHQASNPKLLRQADPDKLCSSCHKGADIKKGHAAYTGELRDCLSCHNPHGSSRKGIVREFLHKSFANGCQACHKGGMATDRDEEFCLECHEPVRQQMFTSHGHLGVQAANSCLACHSPHAGDTQALLKTSTRHLCRDCHEDSMLRYVDRIYKHPKVVVGECSQCHAAHGSNRLAMLKADGIEVCTGCHESQGQFSHPVGEKIRDPRTGEAMTCLDCHNPMGTDFKGNLVMSGTKDLCVQCHQNK